MANWSTLKAAVAQIIKTNNNQEITGANMQSVLNNIIDNVGENATYAGIATPSTNPGAPDGNVFYFATQAGTYTNFGGAELKDGLNILLWNGSNWSATKVMTISQELGNDENAVISQKVISDKLENKSYADSIYASIIKELYIYKTDETDPYDDDLVIRTVYNNADIEIKYSLVIAKSDGTAVAYSNQLSSKPDETLISLSYIVNGIDSGYRGYCILQFDKLNEEGIFNNINTPLKKAAFILDQNSSIKHYLELKQFTQEADEKFNEIEGIVKETRNGIVYSDDKYSSSLIKELYITSKDGIDITQQLYVRTIYNNADVETGIKYSLVISDEDKQAVLYYNETSDKPKTGVIELVTHNNNIVGYAILSFDTLENPLFQQTIMGKLNSNCFDLDKNPSIKEYLQRDYVTQMLGNVDREVNDAVEVDLVSRINNVVNGQYLHKDTFLPIELNGFQYVEIDVTDVYRVKFYAFFGSRTLAIGFKDVEGNIVGQYAGADVGGHTTFEADVPYNAKYAYTSYRILNDTDEVSLTGYILKSSNNETSIKNIEDNYSYEWINVYDSEDTEHIVDQYLNNSLVMNELALFETLKAKCVGARRVKIKAYFGVSTTKCAFQDKDGNFIPFCDKIGRIVNNILGSTGYDLIEIKVPDNAYYVLTSYRFNKNTFGDSGNILLEKRVPKIEDKPFNLSNVMFIPIFGQSLSIGADAIPPITTECKYPGAIMFNTGVRCVKKNVSDIQIFQPLRETTSGTSGETVASGCAEKLIQLISAKLGISPYNDYWRSHKFLFATFGAGSTTISDLTTDPEDGGMSYYDGIVNAITAAKSICDSYGWTLNVPAWIWMQGERDMYLETSNYKEQLLALANQLNTDAKQITLQTNNAICVCYQTGSQNIWGNAHTFNSTRLDVPNDQMELIRDNELFVASIPVYALDHSSEPIHLSAVGEKMCGLYNAISIERLLEGTLMKGVTPASYNVSGNDIEVIFNVPCPPLIFDTTFVKEVSNMGFSVLKSDNSDIITNVELFDDKVTIHCSESPIGCKLYYGLNGTAYRDGRKEGARGNLSDIAGKIYNGEIDGKMYSLPNYCYGFVISITQ